jgi:DNA-binding NarL/FixJ family response regulator
MLSRPLNIAIVDDQALFRKILYSYLSKQKNIHIPIQASNIPDLFNRLKGYPIDILLIDLLMPGLNGIEALQKIRKEHPAIKIIVLSASADMDLISDLLDSGIHGYISKSDEPEELLQAIQAVSESRIFRNRIFTEALYWNKQNAVNASFDESPASLSEREKKIIQLLWEEKNNKEIADELFLGIRTVERTRQEIKEKVGAKSLVGLLKFAIHTKIIAKSSGMIYRVSGDAE